MGIIAGILVGTLGRIGLLRVPILAFAAGLVAAAAALWLEGQGYGFLLGGTVAAGIYAALVLATGGFSLPILCTLRREMVARKGA